MTILLSCITQDYALQVTDRRLVFPDGKLADDSSNKALIYKGHLAVCFTGLARFGGEPTVDWLIQQLREVKGSTFLDACNRVAENATIEVRKVDAPSSLKHHTFHITGWVRPYPPEADEIIEPLAILITNSWGADLGKLDLPSEEFVVLGGIQGLEQGFELYNIGQQVPQDRRFNARRIVRRCVQRSVGPAAIAKLCAAEVAHLAQTNPAVGADVMVVCVTRKAASGRDASVHSGLPSLDKNSFWFMGADGDPLIQFGPAVLMPNGGSVSELKLLYGKRAREAARVLREQG